MQRERCDKMKGMESTHFKIDTKELILRQGRKEGGTETFVYEPANIEEEQLGNLYIIGRLENRKSEFEFLPNLIASVIKREFYKLDEEPVESHFESALKKANATLHDIGKANEGVLGEAHFCAVNISGETIRLSKFGNIATLLWRSNEIADMAKKHVLQNKNDLFSAVITGDVALDDKFIFGTGKAMDLFSKKGIEKLFELSLDEQADIISKIYQKNSREIPLPAQALILLSITSAKTTWIPFGKKMETKMSVTINPRKHVLRIATHIKNLSHTLASLRFFSFRITLKKLSDYSRTPLHRGNALILFAFAAMFAVGGSGYAFARTQFAFIDSIQRRVLSVDTIEDPSTALAILGEAQNDALRIAPSLLLGSFAQKLSYEIAVKINLLHGIHIQPPLYQGAIPSFATGFQPRFIFDDNDFIYIFGSAPSTFYKIAKQTREGSYTFLPQLSDDFEIERMFMRNGELYMLNDTKKAAFLFTPSDNTLVPVLKTLQSTLTSTASQNARTSEDAKYSLEGGNKIIKTPKQTGGTPEKYLIGTLTGIIDFTVSSDHKDLYILTSQAIFSTPL
ncbi:MAG: hypothetical protein NUV61_03815 [Candidatus Azambacteria bacterium]|nr:hypothetical protein [Candidatus Azambacteria bacterium]